MPLDIVTPRPPWVKLLDLWELAFTCDSQDELLERCRITDRNRVLIADLTREQRDCREWWLARSFRITASMCGELESLIVSNGGIKGLQAGSQAVPLKANSLFDNHRKAMNLRKRGLPPKDSFTYHRALRWGTENEATARELYLKQVKMKCLETGIILSTSGGLGASPDGLLYRDEKAMGDVNRFKEGELLEIKCPYSARDTYGASPEETRRKVINEIPYLREWVTDGVKKLELNKSNSQGRRYWNQVQMGMYVSGIKKCHFVVWTPHILLSFGVCFDPKWEEYGQALQVFWKKHFIHALWQARLTPRKKRSRSPSTQPPVIKNKPRLPSVLPTLEVCPPPLPTPEKESQVYKQGN